jgi:hypothetical protein
MVTTKTRYGGSSSATHGILLLALSFVSGAACLPAMAQDEKPKRGGAEPADAEQTWKQLPLDEKQKNNVGRVSEIERRGTFAPGDQPLFDDYFQQFFLARWTWVKNIAASSSKKEKVPGLPAWRKDLRSSHLGKKSEAAAVHDHLNDLVLKFMNQLAADSEFHPAVRVNAMLMIGELNSVEQVGVTPAVPLPEALKVLLAVVESNKLPDGVRAAAMVGILRHADPKVLDEDGRKLLTAAMLRLVAEDPPTGPAAPGREWILTQAVETLGLLKSVGEDAAVYKAMLKTVAEAKLRLCTRSIAADSLGRLNYAGAGGIDAAEAAAVLGKFAIDSCTREIKLYAEESARAKSNMTSPAMWLQWKQRLDTAMRQRLKQRLDVALATLKALAPLAQEPQQPWLAELQTDVKSASDALGNMPDDKLKEHESMPRVEELRKKLAAWLQKKP